MLNPLGIVLSRVYCNMECTLSLTYLINLSKGIVKIRKVFYKSKLRKKSSSHEKMPLCSDQNALKA